MADRFPTLAVDLGLKRIGLAYSPDGSIVTPLPAIERQNRNQAADAVKRALAEWEIRLLVMGIPLGGSSEAEMRRRCAHFIGLLDFDGPVLFQDESGSSLEAEGLMKGAMRYKRDGRVDSLSAQIILQRYLSEGGVAT